MRKQAFGNRQAAVIGLGSGEFGGKIPESRAREFIDAYATIGGNLREPADHGKAQDPPRGNRAFRGRPGAGIPEITSRFRPSL